MTALDTLIDTLGASREDSAGASSVADELGRICRDVLVREHVGLRDDLFEIGADAAATARILARVDASFGVALPLPLLFEIEPTIERIAIEVEHRLAIAAGESPAEVANALSPDQLARLREAVRHRLLFQWNETAAETGQDRALQSLFEKQVASTPDAIAVQFEDRRLSYRELSIAANRLAGHLRRAGAEPGALVGIYLDRSADLVVAIVGVLAAGCTYVAIDPELPPGRAARLVVDASLAVIVTRRELRHRVPSGPRALDVEHCSRDASMSSAAPSLPDAPQAAACVLYAPGWADRPEGVVVSHRSIVNVVEWITRTFETSSRDVFLLSTSPSLAASLYELYAAWTVGAKLVVLPPDAHRDSRWLVEIAKAEGVTILQTSTSMLEGLAAEPSFARLASLRAICSHGDGPDEALVERVFRGQVARLFSVDAPGQTCGATYREYVKGASTEVGGRTTLGRPFPNTELYVLDERLEPLPIGVPGQLFVGGAGQPLGYHAQPDLESLRFLPDPFSPEKAKRLFRTGQEARRLADGTLEPVARPDDDVDVGGYRIKLGALEAILLRDSRVGEAAVVASARTSGGIRLTAYVAPKGSPPPNVADLQRLLTDALPDVASEIVLLDVLPRTSEGAINRGALIGAGPQKIASSAAYAAPRTPREERLVEIWAELLKVPRVGIDDNFFELGGHSLMATQLVAQVRVHLDVDVPLRVLFEMPIVRTYAAVIDKLLAEALTSDVARMPSLSRADVASGSVPSFEESYLLEWERHRAPSSVWNHGERIELDGPLDAALLEDAVRMTLERQESLRRTFDRSEPDWRLGLCRPEQVAFETVDARGQTEDEIAHTIGRYASAPFAFDGTPLIRNVLLQRGPTRHTLLLNWHQIVHDHDRESAEIFTSDIIEHFVALCERRAPNLPALPVRQVDYAKWARDWYVEGGGRVEIEARRAQLADAKPLALAAPPSDALFGPRTTDASFLFDAAESEHFEATFRAQSVTRFMATLAVLAVLLRKWSEEDDFVAMTLRNFRPQLPALARLTGRYTGPIAVRVSAAGNPTWAELFVRARAAALDATSPSGPMPISLVYGAGSPPDHPLGRVVLNDVGVGGRPLAPRRAGEVMYVCEQVRLPSAARAPLFVAVATPNPEDGRMFFNLKGCADRFEPETIEKLARDFRVLLTTIDPHARPFA